MGQDPKNVGHMKPHSERRRVASQQGGDQDSTDLLSPRSSASYHPGSLSCLLPSAFSLQGILLSEHLPSQREYLDAFDENYKG